MSRFQCFSFLKRGKLKPGEYGEFKNGKHQLLEMAIYRHFNKIMKSPKTIFLGQVCSLQKLTNFL